MKKSRQAVFVFREWFTGVRTITGSRLNGLLRANGKAVMPSNFRRDLDPLSSEHI